MTKHHVIISGTGRTGTTFLVQLLTKLGLDTGFTETTPILPNCNAGLELDIRSPDAPYIIKSPWLCDYLDDVLQDGNITIDHAIVPIRDLFSAAESRRDVKRRTNPADYPAGVPGSLWHAKKPEDLESLLTLQLYKLLYAIAKGSIPLTLLHFPRFVYEPAYLYSTLHFLLRDIRFESFLEAFHATARPEMVHNF